MPDLYLSDGAPAPSANMWNWMAELGDRLASNGYPVIPILPGAKCPGRYTQGTWRNYPDWARHCDRVTKPFEISIWQRWPGCGIGIATGLLTGLDIDVTDPDAALEIQALAFAQLGQTPALRIGRNPKRLLVYRNKSPYPSIKKHPLEALARGSQFVAYAIHPDTQQPYRWPDEELADLPLSYLPTVDEAGIRTFLDTAFQLVPPELRRNTLGPDRSADHYYSGGDLRGTLAAVQAALEHIPNDDLHYDDWIRIGLAIKGAVGDAGLSLFEAWSRRAPKSGKSGQRDTPTKVWRGLPPPKKIGAGTLYYFASQNGWVPDHDLILNGAVADAVASVPVGSVTLEAEALSHNAASFDAGKWDKLEKASSNPNKDACEKQATSTNEIIADAGGVLAGLVEWMCETAIYPQPFLALAAAICAVGAAAGRRYSGPWDTRTNVYCIGIAESGSGKEHQLTCLNNLFFAADLIELFAGEEIASGTAVESTISSRAVQLFQIDEFGHFMKSIMNPRATSSHRRDVLVKLTKYTGAATRLVKGTEYANKKERERIDVHEPCVCLYGTTVAQPLWEAFGSGALKDGSVARMLFFQSPENYPSACKPGRSRDVPAELVAGMRRIIAGQAHENEIGFKAAKGQMLDGRNRPSLIDVPYSREADALADELATRQTNLKRANEVSGYAPVWARWLEHINRLALIRAVSRDQTGPMIEVADLRWALALVEHCIGTLVREAEAHMADSQYEATLKRLLDVIRRRGEMTGRELARASQWLSRRDRAELIGQLEESGLIIVQKLTETGGRPGIRVAPVKSE